MSSPTPFGPFLTGRAFVAIIQQKFLSGFTHSRFRKDRVSSWSPLQRGEGSMVTRAQIINLSRRVDEIAASLRLVEPPTYRVALRFDRQSEAEFLAAHPWWNEFGGQHVGLSFDNAVVPRTD